MVRTLSIGLLTSILSLSATAQSMLDPVVVTATKTERPADRVVQSISVIDSEQIELEQPANFGDLVENLPNVDISGGPRSQAERITIRGLEDDRILFTLDGARQNFVLGAHKGRFFVDPDLLKRVEVVRGPNSAVWGSGAIGGVVALTSKDASDFLRDGETLGARVKAGYQDNDQWSAGGTVFGMTKQGTHLDYLLSINTRQSNDIDDGEKTVAYTASDAVSGLGKLKWLGEQQSLGASIQYFDDEGLIPSNASTDVDRDNPLLDRTTQQQTYTLNYQYRPTEQQRLQATLYHTIVTFEETRVDNGRFDETDFDTTGIDFRHSIGLQNHLLTYGFDVYQDS